MKPQEESRDFPIRTIYKDLSRKETKFKNESKEPMWKCRYVSILVAFLVYFYLMYIRLNMSISIVAMVNSTEISQQTKEDVQSKLHSCPSLVMNTSVEENLQKLEGEFNWSPKIQGYILGSYSFGYAATQMPAGILSERYGCKWFLFGASMVTGICTLLIPCISYLSAFAFIALQMLRGFAQGIVQPALIVLAANWFPKTERGFMSALMHSGAPLGCCFGSILTGYICESAGGWSASFYVAGAGGTVLAALILYFTAESPEVHPRISKAEVDFILSNQENVLLRRRPKPPWYKIVKSVPVYALAFAIFGQAWAISQFSTVHSSFLSSILHYSIGQNGLLSAAPFLMQFLGSQGAAWISLYMQKKKVVSVDFLRKFWSFSASLGISLCLFGMYLAGCNRSLSVIFAIMSIGCTGLGYAGCFVVATDMTPTFAGTIHGICCTIGFLASFLVPVVTGYLTDEMQTIEQWNKFFFISIGVVMSSGITFVLFGSAELQSWNFVEDVSSEKYKGQENNFEVNAEKVKKCAEQTRF